MHYEIDYTNKANAAEAAEQDCIEWLGKKQFNKVVAILLADERRSSEQLVLLGLSMQGIQGYPARVLMERYWK
jgi:hypothetical protein